MGDDHPAEHSPHETDPAPEGAEEQVLDALEELLVPDPPASPADESEAPPPG